MAKFGSASLSALVASGVIALGAFMACSTDPIDLHNAANGASSSGASSGSAAGDGGPAGPAPEEVAFRALETDFQKTCGGRCHQVQTYGPPTPPAFLGNPDAYKAVKAYNGIVVADYYSSIILNKGAHEGPALGDTPDLETKIIEWLKLEAIAIQAVKLPTSDPIAIKMGANDIDMASAEISGLTGVHFLFDASIVAGALSLNNIKVHAAAGTDVHVYKPKFIRVLAAPNANMQTELPDLADSFSNTDQTVAAGMDTTLAPGSAFFTSEGWENFDFNSDKIRISVEKLEPGKIIVTAPPKVCKDVAGFTANVLPALKGGNAAIGATCSQCHGNGLAGLTLNAGDQTTVCNQVLAYLSDADITKSLLITHVSAGGGHGGPTLAAGGVTALTQVFTTNKAVFF